MTTFASDAGVRALAQAFGRDVGDLAEQTAEAAEAASEALGTANSAADNALVAKDSVDALTPNVRKLNTEATRAPLPTDEETQGYAVGSRWLWQGQEWVRTDSGWVPLASVASYAPFASYDAANAAPKLPEQSRISAIVNGRLVEWVRDPAGPCLGGGWVPPGPVSPDHWGAFGTQGEELRQAIQNSAQYAMDNRRKFVAREEYLITDQISLTYAGWLDFDLLGAKFTCAPGWQEGKRGISVVGAPDGMEDGTFEWFGGKFDGQSMPRGSLNSCNLLDISVARSAATVHVYVEELYTGKNWEVSGGDTHIHINASRVDLTIGKSQGSQDLGVYHTSSSGSTSRRNEVFRLRGTFIGCRRAASSKRGTANVDVDIDVIDCHYGWHEQPAEFTDNTVPASAVNGTVTVRALRCEYPVDDAKSQGIRYNVTARDMGVYIPVEDMPGAVPYISKQGRALRLRGCSHQTGSVTVVGVNPLVLANSSPILGNFNAVDIGAYTDFNGAVTQSLHNTIDAHATGIGRLLHERDASNFNIISITGEVTNSVVVGSRSEALIRGKGLIYPGPFADDTAASAGGVVVGESYRKTGGALAWRVS